MIATVLECAALLALFICSAFFSSAETALFSLNPIQVHRLRKSRPRAAGRVQGLLESPHRLLSTILIGNTLVNVAAASLGFVLAERLFEDRGVLVAIPVTTVILLVFGEVGPKRVAAHRPERLAAAYSGILKFLVRFFTPLRVVLERMSVVVRSRPDATPGGALTEDEFRTVVEVGEEEGVLDREERTMVDGIIRLEEKQASDVMTPRVDLVGIDLEDPLEEAEKTARASRFRYLPVYEGDLDHVQGFLDVPRYVLKEGKDLGGAMISPFFVPETAPLDTLLTTFQREDRRVAYVVDEFGGTAGLVTRGDILEEIVADVDNEYGDETLTIQAVGENRWLIDGSMSLEDINYELDVELEAEGADRISGWVAAQTERMPRMGDVVEEQGCRVTVRRVRRRRVLLVQLEKVMQETDGEDET